MKSALAETSKEEDQFDNLIILAERKNENDNTGVKKMPIEHKLQEFPNFPRQWVYEHCM